jgi:hypothetical protein
LVGCSAWLHSGLFRNGSKPALTTAQYLRGISRRCPGAGQDGGVQAIVPRQETCRDAVCAFETYTSARPASIARAMRCAVRVHVGCDCSEPPQACQADRPATTNRPFVRCVTLQASVKSSVSRPHYPAGGNGRLQKWHQPSRAVCMPISATKSAKTGLTPDWLLTQRAYPARLSAS